MASLLGVTRKGQTETRRNKLSIPQKRWLLAVHILGMAAWLGGGLCCLALSLIALTTSNPQLFNATYVFIDTLNHTLLRAGAIVSLLSGILLAVLTQWGLLRFYWLNVKEIISLLCVVVDLIAIRWNEHILSLTGSQGFQALSDSSYLSNRTLLFAGILLQIVSLSAIIVISIFKPWGQRKRAVRPAVLQQRPEQANL